MEQSRAEVAEAVRAMGLEHVVVTSVARDDLADGGAHIFAETIRALRREAPGAGVGADTGAGRRKRLESARHQRSDRPREDVAGPRRRQARAVERVDRDALAVGDDRVVSLEDDHRAGIGARPLGPPEPVGGDLIRIAAEQPPELAGVRGEERARGAGCGVRTWAIMERAKEDCMACVDGGDSEEEGDGDDEERGKVG